MKVIIQDTLSRKYLSADQSWTADVTAARDFHFDTLARMALHFNQERRLHVVHYFEELNYCIAARKPAWHC